MKHHPSNRIDIFLPIDPWGGKCPEVPLKLRETTYWIENRRELENVHIFALTRHDVTSYEVQSFQQIHGETFRASRFFGGAEMANKILGDPFRTPSNRKESTDYCRTLFYNSQHHTGNETFEPRPGGGWIYSKECAVRRPLEISKLAHRVRLETLIVNSPILILI